MDTTTLVRLEADFRQLSLTDQLHVLERLARLMREQTAPPPIVAGTWLEEMAADLEMQQELVHIAADFVTTDADGLETT